MLSTYYLAHMQFPHACQNWVCYQLLKIESLINFDFKKLLIMASYSKWGSYLDIHRPVSALYKMVFSRVTLSLITQSSPKKFFSIIFTDSKTSSIVSYMTRVLTNITESSNILNDKDQIIQKYIEQKQMKAKFSRDSKEYITQTTVRIIYLGSLFSNGSIMFDGI